MNLSIASWKKTPKEVEEKSSLESRRSLSLKPSTLAAKNLYLQARYESIRVLDNGIAVFTSQIFCVLDSSPKLPKYSLNSGSLQADIDSSNTELETGSLAALRRPLSRSEIGASSFPSISIWNDPRYELAMRIELDSCSSLSLSWLGKYRLGSFSSFTCVPLLGLRMTLFFEPFRTFPKARPRVSGRFSRLAAARDCSPMTSSNLLGRNGSGFTVGGRSPSVAPRTYTTSNLKNLASVMFPTKTPVLKFPCLSLRSPILLRTRRSKFFGSTSNFNSAFFALNSSNALSSIARTF